MNATKRKGKKLRHSPLGLVTLLSMAMGLAPEAPLLAQRWTTLPQTFKQPQASFFPLQSGLKRATPSADLLHPIRLRKAPKRPSLPVRGKQLPLPHLSSTFQSRRDPRSLSLTSRFSRRNTSARPSLIGPTLRRGNTPLRRRMPSMGLTGSRSAPGGRMPFSMRRLGSTDW
jgi:hypothetical protein